MKKLLNILLIVCCISFVACNDEEYLSPDITIVKAGLDFQAPGGDAWLEYQSNLPVTATVNVDWCKVVSQDASKVKIEVSANENMEGRSALISLSNGERVKDVVLTQSGSLFIYDKAEQNLCVSNAAASYPIELVSSFDYEVSIPDAEQSWLSYIPSDDGKGGSFTVTENTSGSIRGAVVTITSGNRSANYVIMQYDLTDLLGAWRGQYQSYFDGKYYGLSVSITGPDASGEYSIAMLGILPDALTMKATFDEVTRTFSISNAQNVGIYSMGATAYDARMLFLDTSFSLYSSPVYTAGLSPVFINGAGIGLAFADNGGMPSPFGGLFIRLYNGSTLLGNFEGLINCLLYRL